MKPVASDGSLTFAGIDLLLNSAREFAKANIGSYIYKYIAQGLETLNPGSLILVTSTDYNHNIKCIEAVNAPGDICSIIEKRVGHKLKREIYETQERISVVKTFSIKRYKKSNTQSSFEIFTDKVLESINGSFKAGDTYQLQIPAVNQHWVSVILILPEGEKLKNRSIIEIFSNEASAALKRLEAEKNELRYKTLYESISRGVYFVMPDDSITEINDYGLNLVGIKREDFKVLRRDTKQFKVVDENFKPVNYNQLPSTIVYKTGEKTEDKVYGIYSNAKGKYLWLLVNATPIKSGNKISSVLVTLQDVTDIKEITDKAKESQANLRAIMESTKDIIILLARDGTLIDCNSAHAQRLGVTREELIGKNVFDFLPADVAESRRANVLKVCRTGKPVKGEDYRAGFWNEFVILPVWGAKGKADRVAVFSRDITDRRKTEEEIKEREREKASIISNLPGFVYRCYNDSQWTMIFLSENCKSVTGYLPADITENSLISYAQIIHPQHRQFVWDRWQEAIKKRLPFKEEYKIITSTGETKWVWEQGRGVFSQNGDLLYLEGFITDITENKKIEEQLIEKEKILSELNTTKDKFFSIIAHDLKSPFNSIMGISDILLEQVEKEDYEDIKKYAEIIYDSSHRAMYLLSNLLEWSRSQTGRMEYNPEYVRLSSLIEEAVEMLTYSANQKSITIKTTLHKSAITFVDKAMVGSVLRNLISNAIKFTYKGGEISIEVIPVEEMYQISVSDNGTGIVDSELDNLFKIDKYYSSKGTNNESGSGLGLILCKEFVARHKGSIWIESKQGNGTTVFFTLPKKMNTI